MKKEVSEDGIPINDYSLCIFFIIVNSGGSASSFINLSNVIFKVMPYFSSKWMQRCFLFSARCLQKGNKLGRDKPWNKNLSEPLVTKNKLVTSMHFSKWNFHLIQSTLWLFIFLLFVVLLFLYIIRVWAKEEKIYALNIAKQRKKIGRICIEKYFFFVFAICN